MERFVLSVLDLHVYMNSHRTQAWWEGMPINQKTDR